MPYGEDGTNVENGGLPSSPREASPRRQGEKRTKPAPVATAKQTNIVDGHLSALPAALLHTTAPPPTAELSPVHSHRINGRKRQDSRLSPLTAKRQGSSERLCAPAAGHAAGPGAAGLSSPGGISAISCTGSLPQHNNGSSSDFSLAGGDHSLAAPPLSLQNGKQRMSQGAGAAAAAESEEWTPDEDAKILLAHQQLGSRWSEIAKLLPGRDGSAIESRFNSSARRNPTTGDTAATEAGNQEIFAASALLLPHSRQLLANGLSLVSSPADGPLPAIAAAATSAHPSLPPWLPAGGDDSRRQMEEEARQRLLVAAAAAASMTARQGAHAVTSMQQQQQHQHRDQQQHQQPLRREQQHGEQQPPKKTVEAPLMGFSAMAEMLAGASDAAALVGHAEAAVSRPMSRISVTAATAGHPHPPAAPELSLRAHRNLLSSPSAGLPGHAQETQLEVSATGADAGSPSSPGPLPPPAQQLGSPTRADFPTLMTPQMVQLLHRQQQQQLQLMHEQQQQQLVHRQQQERLSSPGNPGGSDDAPSSQQFPAHGAAALPQLLLSPRTAPLTPLANGSPSSSAHVPKPASAASPRHAHVFAFSTQAVAGASGSSAMELVQPVHALPAAGGTAMPLPSPPPAPLLVGSPRGRSIGSSSNSSIGSAGGGGSSSVPAARGLSPVSRAVRETRHTLPAMQPNEKVPLQMLPYYKYLNDEAQRSIMRQLIDQFQRTSLTEVASTAAKIQAAAVRDGAALALGGPAVTGGTASAGTPAQAPILEPGEPPQQQPLQQQQRTPLPLPQQQVRLLPQPSAEQPHYAGHNVLAQDSAVSGLRSPHRQLLPQQLQRQDQREQGHPLVPPVAQLGAGQAGGLQAPVEEPQTPFTQQQLLDHADHLELRRMLLSLEPLPASQPSPAEAMAICVEAAEQRPPPPSQQPVLQTSPASAHVAPLAQAYDQQGVLAPNDPASPMLLGAGSRELAAMEVDGHKQERQRRPSALSPQPLARSASPAAAAERQPLALPPHMEEDTGASDFAVARGPNGSITLAVRTGSSQHLAGVDVGVALGRMPDVEPQAGIGIPPALGAGPVEPRKHTSSPLPASPALRPPALPPLTVIPVSAEELMAEELVPTPGTSVTASINVEDAAIDHGGGGGGGVAAGELAEGRCTSGGGEFKASDHKASVAGSGGSPSGGSDGGGSDAMLVASPFNSNNSIGHSVEFYRELLLGQGAPSSRTMPGDGPQSES